MTLNISLNSPQFRPSLMVNFIETLRGFIREKNFNAAIQYMLEYLPQLQTTQDAEQIYSELLLLFHHFSAEQFLHLRQHLPQLLLWLTESQREQLQVQLHFWNFLPKNSIEALSQIRTWLDVTTMLPSVNKMYSYVFQWFTDIDDTYYGSLVPALQDLLNASTEMFENQFHLCFLLAKWNYNRLKKERSNNGFRFALEAAQYIARAIQIANARNLDSSTAYQLGARLIGNEGIYRGRFATFNEEIEKFKREANREKIKVLMSEAEGLVRFSSHQPFFKYVQRLIGETPPSKHSVWYDKEISEKVYTFIPKVELVATALHYYLEKFRDIKNCFNNFLLNPPDSITPKQVRDFQEKIFSYYQELLKLFISDIIFLLGKPPCDFEILAMGSLGRKEPCSRSDCEIMVLYEDLQYRTYFEHMIDILRLQICLLGETDRDSQDKRLVFTCIHQKNPQGFMLEGNPYEYILTPQQLEDLQEQKHDDPSTFAHMSYKATPIYKHNPNKNLKITSSRGQSPQFNQTRRQNALSFLQERLQEFKSIWKSPSLPVEFNLKKHFAAPLSYFLADLSLPWEDSPANTLDLIDDLILRGMFCQQDGMLLKEAIASIYIMRLKLHALPIETTEECRTTTSSNLSDNLSLLSREEQLCLEKYFWLILVPLYSQISNFLPVDATAHSPGIKVFNFSCIWNGLGGTLYALEILSPYIRHLVTYMVTNNAPLNIHVDNFKWLTKVSNSKNLRQTYFDVLIELHQDKIVEQLVDIPTRSGERISYSIHFQNLVSSLNKLTQFEKPPNCPIQVKIVGGNSLNKYLTPEDVNHIVDSEGNIKNSYPGSAHLVTGYGGLHFKQKPMHPMMEFAIHNLFYRLGGFLSPASTLVRFEVEVGKSTKVYPVLISMTISGETLKALDQSNKSLSSNDIDRKQWTWMVIGSVLTRPGDGLPSNYIMNEQGKIFCIDNDISFVEPITQRFFNWRVFHFCSALFCFLHQEPLDLEVLQEFCSLDPDLILDAWMEDIINQEKVYSSLFSPTEHLELFQKDEENRFITEVLFKEGTLATLNSQFWRMQNYIHSSLEQKKTITSLDLLSQLLSLKDSLTAEKSTGANVSEQYLEAIKREKNIGKRLEFVTSRNSTQSISTKTSEIACFGKPLTLEEYQKLKPYSASKAREELRVTLIGKPGEDILKSFMKGSKTINASFKKIETNGSPDLARQTLIFDSLVSSLILRPQKYETVILNYCSVLNSAKLTPFFHPGLRMLDLRYSSPLDEALLEVIARECCNLEELYLEESSLHWIAKKGLITNDPLFFPNLKHLQVEKCHDLQQIRLKVPKLRKLIVADNLKLNNIEISDLEFFPEMDFRNCPSLDLKDLFNKLKPLMLLERLIEKQMRLDQAILPYRLPHGLFEELGNAISKAIVTVGYEKTYQMYIDPLFHLIEHSKLDSSMGQVAANAITILNFANISLAEKDFKGIRIPGANLGRALLAYTNLENAVLDEVCLAEAVLTNANLKGAQLNKLDLGPIRLACPSPVTALCSGPKGQLYIGCTDGSIIQWNFAESEHAVIEKVSAPLEYLIVTENEELLFVEKNRKEIRAKKLYSSVPSNVMFNFENYKITSPTKDGNCLIFQNEKLWILNIKSQTKQEISDQMPNHLNTIVWSPNKELLAGFINNGIYTWEIYFHLDRAEASLRTLDADSLYECLAWSKKGDYIAAGDKNGIIKIWKAYGGVKLQEIRAHFNNITAIVWLDDKRVASASDDRTIKIWDITTGKNIRNFEGHLSNVKNLFWLDDDNKLVSIESDTVRIWDIDNHGYLKQLPGHCNQICALSWDKEGGSVVSGSFDRTLRFWDALLFCEVKPPVQLPYPIHDLACSKEKKLAACYPKQKNFVSIWNVDKGKEEKELRFRPVENNFQIVIKLHFIGPERVYCSAASSFKEPTSSYIYDIPNSGLENFISSYDFWTQGGPHQKKGYTKKIVFDPLLEGKIEEIAAINSLILISGKETHVEINHNCPITGFFQLKPDLFLMGDENGKLTCWKIELQNKEDPFLILKWTDNLIFNCKKLNITGAKELSKLNRKVLIDYGAYDNSLFEQALKSESIQTVGQTRKTRSLFISYDEYQNQNKDSFGSRKSSLTASPKLSFSGKDSFFEFRWNASTVASTLWMDSTAQISKDMVLKVNAVSSYLKQQHLEMRGAKADGNCFCYAYLGSLNTLIQKVPSIELSKDKIGFLRKTIADQYEQSTLGSKNQDRIVQIKRDREWIVASGEGDLLAQAMGIPIRVITVNIDQGVCGISDLLTFTDRNKPCQDWKTIPIYERPLETIIIIDLGGHFIYAKPIL